MNIQLVSLALLATTLALPAAASPGHAHLLEVDCLRATAEPGGVRIELDLNDSTRLRRLERSGLDPGLAIDFGRRTEVIELKKHLNVRLMTRRTPHNVSVRLVDRSPQQRHDLLRLSLGGIVVDSATLPLSPAASYGPPPPPPQTSWYNHPPVVEACRAAFPHHQRAACRQAVAEAKRSPVALISSCDKAFYGADETLQCLLIGIRTPASANALEACDAAFYGATDTLSCMRSVAVGGRNMRADIAACDAAFYGSAATLTCVQDAARQSTSMSAAIAQCDATFYSEADEAQCVTAIAMASSPELGLEVLTHCDAKKRDDRKELKCLERRLSKRVAHRR